jgi:hypothetical protein
VQQSFTAKEYVLKSLYHFNVHITALAHSRKVAGVKENSLACLKLDFLTVTVDLKENKAVARDPLHDQTLTAENTAEASVKMHEKFGFKQNGYRKNCGYKFGKWHSVVFLEKQLNEFSVPPKPVIPIGELDYEF